MTSALIKKYEEGRLTQNLPEFHPGDTVVVQVRVKEGSRERLQAFKGHVIAIKNRGLNSSVTVRKRSHGVGVERVFQLHSPLVASIKVERSANVRRAKPYYIRERTGKSERFKERVKQRGAVAKNDTKSAMKSQDEPKEETQQEED